MDIVQRVQVLIGGDASQAKKVIKEVEGELKASQARQRSTAATTGAQTGDAYGRAYNRAQDRWLKVAEDGFRKYGGTVGGILGDILGQFDKIGKAREATDRLRQVGGGVGGRVAGEAAGEFGGSLLGQAGATAVGAGVGAAAAPTIRKGRSKISKLLFGKESPNVGFGENIFDRISLIANRRRMADIRSIIRDESLGENRIFLARNLLNQNRKTGLGKLISDLSYQSSEPRVGSVLSSALDKSRGLRGVAGEAAGAAGTLLKAGIRPLALGAGVTVAVAGAAAMALKSLAAKSKENAETRKQIELSKELIKEIDNIQDPAKKTAEILRQFGADGQQKFRDLKQEVSDLQAKLGSEDWQNAADKAAYAWKAIKDTFSDYVFTPISNGFGKLANYVTGFISGMDNEMVESARKTELNILKNQRRIDQLREKNAQLDKEKETKRLKLLEDIDKERDKTSQLLRDEIPLLNQQFELETIIYNLSIKKNKSLEDEYNYRKAINELIVVDNKMKKENADLDEKSKEAARDESARRTAIINEQADARLNAGTLMERSGMTAEAFSGNTQSLPFTAPSSFSPAGKTVYNRAWENAQRLKQNALNAKAAQLSKQVKSIDEIYNEQGFLTVKAKNGR